MIKSSVQSTPKVTSPPSVWIPLGSLALILPDAVMWWNVEEPPNMWIPLGSLALMFPDAVIFPKKWASFTNVLKGPIINVLPTDNVPTPESPPVAVSSSRDFL